LDKAFEDDTPDRSKGGLPPFDRLMMFKALIVQGLYNLSDDQLEYQIVDRASFKRFLGLKRSYKVPDSETFWAFREQLIEKNVIEACSKHLTKYLIQQWFSQTRAKWLMPVL